MSHHGSRTGDCSASQFKTATADKGWVCKGPLERVEVESVPYFFEQDWEEGRLLSGTGGEPRQSDRCGDETWSKGVLVVIRREHNGAIRAHVANRPVLKRASSPTDCEQALCKNEMRQWRGFLYYKDEKPVGTAHFGSYGGRSPTKEKRRIQMQAGYLSCMPREAVIVPPRWFAHVVSRQKHTASTIIRQFWSNFGKVC
jgi:hypothetical protein